MINIQKLILLKKRGKKMELKVRRKTTAKPCRVKIKTKSLKSFS